MGGSAQTETLNLQVSAAAAEPDRLQFRDIYRLHYEDEPEKRSSHFIHRSVHVRNMRYLPYDSELKSRTLLNSASHGSENNPEYFFHIPENQAMSFCPIGNICFWIDRTSWSLGVTSRVWVGCVEHRTQVPVIVKEKRKKAKCKTKTEILFFSRNLMFDLSVGVKRSESF